MIECISGILLVILLFSQHKIPQIEGQDINLAREGYNYYYDNLVASVTKNIPNPEKSVIKASSPVQRLNTRGASQMWVGVEGSNCKVRDTKTSNYLTKLQPKPGEPNMPCFWCNKERSENIILREFLSFQRDYVHQKIILF